MKRGTPIVNETHFTDAAKGYRPPSLNPGVASEPFPNGPPRYVSAKGKSPRGKGQSNKRITENI